MKIKEKRTIKRDFGFLGNEVIIDHDKHGRILVIDGYGGEQSLSGGAVRWLHGLVVKLKNNDTFESLDKPWNEGMDTLYAVTRGYDDTRPLLDWSGFAIEKMMETYENDYTT